MASMNAHAADQVQTRMWRAQAARALGDNNCAHCSVPRRQPHGPRTPPDRTVGSARPLGVAAQRGSRQSGASADQASAAGDGRSTPAALLLLGAQSHAANAPAHTQPSTTRQLNAHAAGKAWEQAGRAQAARALGKHNRVHCGVRAGSSTARGHCRIAPLALPDH